MTLITPTGRAARPTDRTGGVLADLCILIVAAALLWGLVQMGQRASAPASMAAAQGTLDTNPWLLPGYTGQSLVRMFAALAASVVFTFVYATAAARSRRLGAVLIPLLDVLQSVPVLGFLSVTVTFWIALFPGSRMGLECASVFAIFTSQAWNMTFALHDSMIAQKQDLVESARLLRLTRWQRFWTLDLPGGMIPLTWNAMMSFGGGWFFLTASEAISVNGHSYVLPGIGSYVAAASQQRQLGRLCLAIAVMLVTVWLLNAVVWSPLLTWAQKFRLGDTGSSENSRSVVLDLLRRSHLAALATALGRSLSEVFDTLTRPFGAGTGWPAAARPRRRVGDIVCAAAIAVPCVWGALAMVGTVQAGPGLGEFGRAFALGLATLGRVVAVIVLGTLIWVPVGAVIGMNTRLRTIAQPIVQMLASFPANFLFPFVTLLLVRHHWSLNWGGIVLMALGSQWYILFNVIAAASAMPADLREAATSLGLPRALRWRTLILPAIFPAWVTGALTAAGGAWNASIVAEVVSYGDTTLRATGLGAYVADATAAGDFPRVLVGVLVMCVYVVGLNRLVWRPLGALANRRFSIA
ncbi:NitT/TauT family transport system permease protein [Propionibacterium cyclohexanicum]|uniref:NitT/TauT family transport system permease protein n=1 Tax=Propionibacterium cyclohexanicum TaxID=64702 RepID=A0A1H9RMK3_9ACTN|nr:ABC transporter permease subunit [Propionibacterium cyclohexanicum]SER73808.1 NitT/TauT family transport system permease protein [Propionibacterium cyclohexanicum]